MRGHTNIRVALATLLLVCFLGATPGVASPAAATPTTTADAESSSSAAPEDASDDPEQSPSLAPSEEEATPEPSEPESTPTEIPESTESPAPEDPERDSPKDEATEVEAEEPAEEESAPQQRMQRNAGANTATVQVKVGGSRTGSGVAPLPGATLGLFSSLEASSRIQTSWAQCTSGSDGVCTFKDVPADGSWGRPSQLFVKAVSAPSGYSIVKDMSVTGSDGRISRSTYGFQVGERTCVSWGYDWRSNTYSCSAYGSAIHSGETYRSFSEWRQPADFMSADGSSDGIFPFIRNNPALPAQCGIDVAAILDFSESMRGSEGALSDTVTTLVDTLQGTPSSFSLFNFGSASPAESVGLLNRPEKQSVETDAGAETVRNWYSYRFWWSETRYPRFSIPFNQEGTNWDRGLYIPAGQIPKYEAAVIITDGNPTYHGALKGNGSQTSFANVENSIFSANALKAKGTHVVAVGTGKSEIAGSVSSGNLLAISGPGASIQRSDFQSAARELATMMEQNCDSSVAVDKNWVINGTEYQDGDQPEGLDAELLLSDPRSSSGETREASWDRAYEGYTAGDQIRLDENLNISESRPGCRLDKSEISAINQEELDSPIPVAEGGYRSDALAAGLTRFTVTNTLTCEQSLTLDIDVEGGNATSADWELTAYSTPEDPSRGKPVFTGTGGNAKHAVSPGQTFQLAAAKGPRVYVQDQRSASSRSPLATGSWRCLQTGVSGEGASIGGSDGTIKVPLGAAVNCTATTRTAGATLLKHVVNEHGGTISAEDFELGAESELDGTALVAGPVAGSETENGNSSLLVRPGQRYVVKENSLNANLAFQTGELQRYTGVPDADGQVDHADDALWETLPDGEFVVAAEGHEIYRLVSYDVAPSVLPQTGGIGTLPYLLGGAVLIALGGLAAIKLRNPAQNKRRSAS